MVLLVNEWEVGVKREVHLLLSCYYNIRLILFQTETIRFLFDSTFSGLCLCKLNIIVWTNQDSWRRKLLLWELVMTTFFMICCLWKLFWEQGPLTEDKIVLITNWIYTFTTICTLMLSTICVLKLFKQNTPDMWCDGSKSYESFHSFRVKNIKLMLLHKSPLLEHQPEVLASRLIEIWTPNITIRFDPPSHLNGNGLIFQY